MISTNINAMPLLFKYPHLIDWIVISSNINAIDLIKLHITQHKDDLDWSALSSNPNAISILEQNIDMINWTTIWANPNIFNETHIYNYALIRQTKRSINEAIISYIFHPRNIINGRLERLGFNEFGEFSNNEFN
jgi:hypothetical protein